MQVSVTNVYTDHKRVFNGLPHEILIDLNEVYGSRLRFSHDTLDSVLEDLSRQQALIVEVNHHTLNKSETNLGDDFDVNSRIVQDMHGSRARLERTFEAARFLVGGTEPSLESIRRILWDEDGDAVRAALRAFGMEDTPENRMSLDAVGDLASLQKAESAVAPTAFVEAGVAGAEETAAAITRAAKDQKIVGVQLGGKHSKGSMVARDPETNKTYLMKPGSAQQSPALGARQDPSSQSEREACFWAMAHLWGMGNDLPVCHLILVDGRQYACMELLALDYRPLEDIQKKSPSKLVEVLEKYRHKGQLHRWAIMDAILGNPDRHLGNLMCRGDGDLKLIDHGSAFAGASFDPAHDRNSFVPCYLRYGAPRDVNFNSLNQKEKTRYMATVSTDVDQGVEEWLRGVTAAQLETVLPRFGVNPRACVDRLARIRNMASNSSAATAIVKFWAGA